ncbi:MAG: SulP family inorganic anion transporter [Nostocoides sp.]
MKLAGVPTPTVARWWPIARSTWKADILAGLTLWGLVVPESVAYSSLAGAPPSSGIWAVVLILPTYALFGWSRHLVATPTSAAAVTMGGIVSSLSHYPAMKAVGAVTLAVGVVFLIAHLFRLGFLVHFISEPINAGFMVGLAIFITISQLSKVLGIDGGHGNALRRLGTIAAHLGKINWFTVLIAAFCLGVLLVLPKVAPKAPAGLIMVAVAAAIVAVFQLDSKHHVATPGAIPTGLPGVTVPNLAAADWGMVIAGAVGLVLLAYSEASTVARDIADKQGYVYPSNRDLFPFGLGNVVGGFFGTLIGAGSMSSTSTNVRAGAQTPISTLTTAAAALITALFLGGIFASLPEAALGVLIIHAVARHITFRFYGKIVRYSPAEASIAVVAALGVLIFDVLWGLVIAMVLSLMWFMHRTTSSVCWRVGQATDRPGLLVREGMDTYAALPANVLGLRFGGQIFYGNVDGVVGTIEGYLSERAPAGHAGRFDLVVLDMEGQSVLDYTTGMRLVSLGTSLASRGLTLALVGVRGDGVGEMLDQLSGPDDHLVMQRSTDLSELLKKHPLPL